jgi:hypothetical protein
MMDKTYVSWMEGKWKSAQKEYTVPTRLLGNDGTLLASGWARHNVFDYDRKSVKKELRRKEWDFYQISNGRYMVQISFANISLGGYTSAVIVDLKNGKTVKSVMSPFLGGKDKYILPPKGDVPNYVHFEIGKAVFEADTKETVRTLYFSMGDVEAKFTMDILPGLENITTVLPFDGFPDRYFMTTKQNSMPCEGYFKFGNEKIELSKEDTFCVLDWGRVDTPYSLVWYWGNGSAYITGPDGQKHIFGFEITWGIGNESNATETCIFYDGKAHKFGAVDVETFPKPDKYMEPWHFVSEDGKFDMTMKPFFDHHSDLNVLAMRMHSHQVHGIWSGTATLEDGTVLEIKDMYAFCEYVENRW